MQFAVKVTVWPDDAGLGVAVSRQSGAVAGAAWTVIVTGTGGVVVAALAAPTAVSTMTSIGNATLRCR